MVNEFSRTELLLGRQAIEKLHNSHVAIFGIGGVGGYVAEALARSGLGQLDLIDNDTVSLTNMNRQIIALHSTVGRPKVEVMKERILDINPKAETHLLVVPKKHVESLNELEDEILLGKLMMTVKEATKKLGIKSYKTLINTGAEAGQVVFHLHIHILAGKMKF